MSKNLQTPTYKAECNVGKCEHFEEDKTLRKAFKKLADHIATKHPEMAMRIYRLGYGAAMRKSQTANDDGP